MAEAEWVPGVGWDIPVDVPGVPFDEWAFAPAVAAGVTLSTAQRKNWEQQHPIATPRDRYGMKGSISYRNNVAKSPPPGPKPPGLKNPMAQLFR